jgi:four helix bundle protein
MSYRKLEIWQLARENVIQIHKMTLKLLPSFELYEDGSQIRRSCKSVKSTIVEGYGRKRYVNDYIRLLTYSLASNDETMDHLETLFETESLKDEAVFNEIKARTEILGKKLNNFISKIENDQQQAARGQKPEARGQRPEASNQKPAASSPQPATSSQQPVASNQ